MFYIVDVYFSMVFSTTTSQTVKAWLSIIIMVHVDFKLMVHIDFKLIPLRFFTQIFSIFSKFHHNSIFYPSKLDSKNYINK